MWDRFISFHFSRLHSDIFPAHVSKFSRYFCKIICLFVFQLFSLVRGWLLYNIVVVFAIHWHESAMDLRVFPILNPLPPPSPSHPSGSSQCTSPEHVSHASNLVWRSVSHLIIYMLDAVLPDHSALASVLPKNIQGWFPLEWTGWSCLQWRNFQELSPTSQFRKTNYPALSFLYDTTLTSTHDYWKNQSFD